MKTYSPTISLLLKAHFQVLDNFGNGKPFKSDEKGFLFHLKSSFRSQEIEDFGLTFWPYIKTAWLKM